MHTKDMSIRRFMTLVSFFIVLACNREQSTTTATSTSKTTTGTVASEADLRNAKVKETISTAVIEQTTDARLGSHANPSGVVIEQTSDFTSGAPVILSMTVKQSPSGLQMSAIWKDAKGKVLDQERKPMNGAKTATFSYGGKKLKPGDYSVTGYWGGNIATEKKFKVTK